MTISKEQARELICEADMSYSECVDLLNYIESVDSGTSIRAELRRAAMDNTVPSVVALWVADAFVTQSEVSWAFDRASCRSWFYLMVAEGL